MSSPLTKLGFAISSLVLACGVAATPALGSSTDEARILGGDPCNASVPQVSDPQPSSLKIGTFNIIAGSSVSDFSSAVHAFLPNVDIGGLQETNSKDKAQVLANLTDNGWDFYRQYRPGVAAHPDQGGAEQEPVIWRADRFVCTYAGPVLMSPLYSLQGELPAYDDNKPHFFTVVHLVDKVTGQKIAIINVHMVQGAVKGGHPVPGLSRHWHLYVDQMEHIIAGTEAQQGYGTVFTMGDFNAGWLQDKRDLHAHLPYRSFHAIHEKSMWATQTPKNGMGTHQNALIDQVFSTMKAAHAKVLFSLKGYSDHVPALATYDLPAASS
jgi:endonuclease/exonuclease/phosphatase family metal-dependent hydrolase